MVDTTTPLLGLLLMGTGGDSNAWGSNLNTQVITLAENAIAGITSLSVTGGSHSLSTTEARSAHIVLTGILTSDQTIVVPGTAKKWAFVNQTTGSFFVIVKAGSGTGVNVPQGTTKDIICTDANTVIRKDAEKVGTLFDHMGATAPAGSFECDGSTPLRASAIDLFAAVGTTWGTGNGTTTFTLLNTKDTGRFRRSRTGSLALGTYQTNQNLAHTHTVTGAPSAGSLVTDSQGAHVHTATVTDPGHAHSVNQNNVAVGSTSTSVLPASSFFGTGIATVANTTGITVAIVSNGAHTHTVTGAPGIGSLGTASQGGSEARPEAAVVMTCVWY